MTGQIKLPSSRLALMAAALIALFAALALASTSPSTAIAGEPAICDQYPDLPQCEKGGNGGGTFCDRNPDSPRCDEGVPGGRGPDSGGAGPSGDASNGELPFTGYPLTPLLLLLVILLAAGLTIRSYLAARDGLRSGHRPGSA